MGPKGGGWGEEVGELCEFQGHFKVISGFPPVGKHLIEVKRASIPR